MAWLSSEPWEPFTVCCYWSLRCKVGGRGRLAENDRCHAKSLGFYFVGSRKSLKVFKEGDDVVRLAIWRDHSGRQIQ